MNDNDTCPLCGSPVVRRLGGHYDCTQCHWRSDDPEPFPTWVVVLLLSCVGWVVAYSLYNVWRAM